MLDECSTPSTSAYNDIRYIPNQCIPLLKISIRKSPILLQGISQRAEGMTAKTRVDNIQPFKEFIFIQNTLGRDKRSSPSCFSNKS